MQYAQQRSSSSNAIGIGLVVVLHLGVGYALLQSVGWDHVQPAPAPLHAFPLEPEKKIVEPPPSLPQPKIEPQKLDWVPMPIITITPPVSMTPRPLTPTPPETRDLPQPGSLAPPAPPVETLAGAKRLAGPPLVYPARPKSMGLEGWVDVQCDVDDMGSTSNCSMIAHDGAMAFVDEALDFVKATRYSPATRNGVAVTEKGHRFHIAFTLSDK